MPISLAHDLKFDLTPDDRSAQDFVVSLRRFVLDDLAKAMRSEYEQAIAPKLQRMNGEVDISQDDIHTAMRTNTLFQIYSGVRYNAQEMSWRSVIPGISQNIEQLRKTAEKFKREPTGSLTLDSSLEIPTNVAKLDVHLMPGGYVSDTDLLSGAIYDNGLTVFTAGMVGPEMDDIGQSFSRYVTHKFPHLKPEKILDCGCTIGHHTVPWAQNFPDAEVHAIDVSGSMLTYGHVRAVSLGVPINFRQMNATALQYEDCSFDIIFSSQFLHELPLKDIVKYFSEAYRVLKPGGLLITMELPPNKMLEPYDQFYLDWDCYYNREPYYRKFRDADLRLLLADSGFDWANYSQFTIPQYFTHLHEDFEKDLDQEYQFDDKIGRMSSDFRYFGFGLVKS
ncbi:class I SAM-dependent methyltransferase [uncultured Parasphingorhabdus sp.]|uniref:class I SAM-dependent methyltransferase n=1 Tax=uncultured Parasphingorhabdus sp. TaxID=2709694 RepID=UPI0030DB9253|tara:strand:+ start:7248 stop:8426 length:1179 start_codon:yes stop_codon:yes gene_type:complete